MPALLSLLFSRAGLIGMALVALLLFGCHERNHLLAEGAAHELAALKTQSDELTRKEAAHVAEVAKNYAESSAKLQETLDAQTQAADAQHTSDLKRVQDYLGAYRRQHPEVASAPGANGSADQGTSGAVQGQDITAGLGLVGVELADALRDSSAALSACMKDRDSLTGKP